MAFTILLIGPFLKLDFRSIIIFSACLSISDYLRAKILTGFPWNIWAYSISWLNEILQIINIIGLFSFNLLVITFFTIPIIGFFNISTFQKIFTFCISIFFILGTYIFGDVMINKNKKQIQLSDKKVYVKIISPNFKLKYGLTDEQIKERLKKLIRYSAPDKNKKTLFIWPEGVFSGYSFDEILILKDLISENFSSKHHIIFGTNRFNEKKNKYYNSMLIVNNQLEIIQSYNKRKLVPFGEFLPIEEFFNKFGLKKITEGYGSYLKGRENNNLLLNELNILPMICYEIIFNNLIYKSIKDTNLIINISEDGWFGKTIGPDQHFAKSIFRAIESNTFLLRSANKGVSAIIDNKGNIIKELNRNEAGSIDFEVPLIKSNKIKNDLIFLLLLITYLLFFQLFKEKNAKK